MAFMPSYQQSVKKYFCSKDRTTRRSLQGDKTAISAIGPTLGVFIT